jgi:hypothetical protein
MTKKKMTLGVVVALITLLPLAAFVVVKGFNSQVERLDRAEIPSTAIKIIQYKYPQQYEKVVLLKEKPSCSSDEYGIRFSSTVNTQTSKFDLCWISPKSGEIGVLPDYYRVVSI